MSDHTGRTDDVVFIVTATRPDPAYHPNGDPVPVEMSVGEYISDTLLASGYTGLHIEIRDVETE